MRRNAKQATHFFLYFFVAQNTRLVKIGSTVNPQQRQNAIKCAQREGIDFEESYMVSFPDEESLSSAEKWFHGALDRFWEKHPCSNSVEYFSELTHVAATYLLLMHRDELGWLEFVKGSDIAALQCGRRRRASFVLPETLIEEIKAFSDRCSGGNQACFVECAFAKHLLDDSIDYVTAARDMARDKCGKCKSAYFSIDRDLLDGLSEIERLHQLPSRSDVARAILQRYVSELR